MSAWVASCDTCGWEQACNEYAAAGACARDHGANCPDPYTRVYERAERSCGGTGEVDG